MDVYGGRGTRLRYFSLISMVKLSKNGKQYNFLRWPNVKHNFFTATIKF